MSFIETILLLMLLVILLVKITNVSMNLWSNMNRRGLVTLRWLKIIWWKMKRVDNATLYYCQCIVGRTTMVTILRVEVLPRYFFKIREKAKKWTTILLKIIYIIPLNLHIYHDTIGLHVITNLKTWRKNYNVIIS